LGGCADCYIPLLLIPTRLSDLAQGKQNEKCVIVDTYEGDSIVNVERGVPVSPADVKPRERHIGVRGRTYRYQEVSASEVLRLLENPEGTIPIHRMRVLAREELRDLIASFRAVK
jgi:hypothetical protein